MNKFEKTSFPIKELSNGDSLNINLFRVTGETPGPHVHIQASVHGAELQGNAVIFQLLKYFKEHPINGSITFIPLANPYASNNKNGTFTQGRFNPITGHNWNRNYVDLTKLSENCSGFNLESFVKENLETEWEKIKLDYKKSIFSMCNYHQEKISQMGMSDNKKLNLLLQKVASTSDIVLDLHTGPEATRYLYVAEYEEESAKNLHFPHMLIIPNEFAGAMDEATFIPWLALQREFKKHNRIIPMDFEAFTVELGSEEKISLSDAEIDRDRILNYLSTKGVVKDFSPLIKGNQYRTLLKDYKTYYSPKGGICEYLKCPGEIFKKGDVLAKILNFAKIENFDELDNAVTEIVAREDGIIINHAPSASISEGVELYQVMENYTTL